MHRAERTMREENIGLALMSVIHESLTDFGRFQLNHQQHESEYSLQNLYANKRLIDFFNEFQ